ncbi:MAG: hypothetical protein ACI835_000564 [Planctomycetota bacterium]|jgi:hypothetical protein
MKLSSLLHLLCPLLTVLPVTGMPLDPVKLKVFVLAGQSNMEGKVQNNLLEHQALDPATRQHFAHLRTGADWVVRDDVFIKFLERHGGLTMGYGSRDRTGLELEFGTVLAEHFEEPVLLIKTAWGGHSLGKLFRSPSAGLPEDARLEEELAKAVAKATKHNSERGTTDALPTLVDIQAEYGSSYRMMMQEIADTLASVETLFPTLNGVEPELAGFVWFQGWNDQYEGLDLEYESNMKHFIDDVRRDLETPTLPFVIGVMGQNGSTPAQGAMLRIQEAQLAMAQVPAFVGNVVSIRTDALTDAAAEELYPTWKDNLEQWQKVGSDHRYHYLGSAIWFTRMGRVFGEGMISLLEATD